MLDGFTKIDVTRFVSFSVSFAKLSFLFSSIGIDFKMFVDSTGNGTSLHISPVLVFGSITFSIFSFFCLVAFNCELFKYLRVF